MSVAVGSPADRDAPAPRNQAKFCGRAQKWLVSSAWSICFAIRSPTPKKVALPSWWRASPSDSRTIVN